MAIARGHLVRSAFMIGALIVVNFLLPRLLPGSPLTASGEGSAAFLPEAAQAELRRSYGIDRPLAIQFTDYLVRLARADLGYSLASHRPVSQMIAERLPWTISLVGAAVLVAALLGGALGTRAAWQPHGLTGRVFGPLLIGIGALPEFLVAMALIVVLGVQLKAFPVGSAITPFRDLRPVAAAQDVLWHATLPGLTLLVGLVPAFFLLSRNALVGALAEPFLLAARGKGLGPRGVLRHAWRNALPPVLTLLGLRLAFVVTGAVLVERIFAYPGMGLLLFDAVVRRDYPVLQGIFLVASIVILAVNLALDLTACVLDPRLRQAAS